MTFATIQQVDKTSPVVYYLTSTESVSEGEFLARDGTGMKNVGFYMPKCKAYSDASGKTKTIGLSPYKRGAVDTSTIDDIPATYDMLREIAPITEGDFYLENTGSTDVVINDPIAPCVTGFQKATSNMYVVGYAMEDIASGDKGFVRINIEVQRTA